MTTFLASPNHEERHPMTAPLIFARTVQRSVTWLRPRLELAARTATVREQGSPLLPTGA